MPGCRSGSPTMLPAAAAACPGARKALARPIATRPTRWSSGSGLERGGGSADRDRRCLLHSSGRRSRRGSARRGQRRAARQARDSRLGRLGARSPAAVARGRREGWLRHCPPDLRDPPDGPDAAARSARRHRRRGGLRRTVGDLLRIRRRSRHLPSRADRVRDPRAGRRAGRPRLRCPPLQQSHLRDRPQPRHRQELRFFPLPARAANSERSPETGSFGDAADRVRVSRSRGRAPWRRRVPCGGRAGG